MYQKMLLKRMCGGKSRLGKNCEIFFNEEQSITKVKLKGLDHSTALVIGRVSKIQGFWVEQGLFHSFFHHPNFLPFLMLYQSSAALLARFTLLRQNEEMPCLTSKNPKT